jgi:hypothetical protein
MPSGPEGFVDIHWSVAANGNGRMLKYGWQEHDGPAVVVPARRGSGGWLRNPSPHAAPSFSMWCLNRRSISPFTTR